MPDDTNYVTPSQIGETGSLSDSNTEAPSEQIEGDYPCDVSYEEQVSSQTLLSPASQFSALIVLAEAESTTKGKNRKHTKRRTCGIRTEFSK